MKRKLVQGQDYYVNDQGLYVFTAEYLLARGYCCGNACKHCPYSRAQFEEARAKKRSGRLWLD